MALLTNLLSEKKTYTNSETLYQPDFANTLDVISAFVFAPKIDTTPDSPIPVHPLDRDKLMANQADQIYRLGHSSVLMQLEQKWILTDPVLSERASPITWFGPKRFHQSPIAIEDIPQLDMIIISHDHYDHLDKSTVLSLADQTKYFITPLKVGDRLIKWGIAPDKVVQLDWWQSIHLNDIELVATPAQHFSGRSLWDRDQTLWASWVIKGQAKRIFFSGDSGYFSGFKTIGERYGPFDLTLMEAGAYHELWPVVHMTPEQSVQAHLDLKGKLMMPIHNATFELSLHPWFEPLERISQLTQQLHIPLLAPQFGEQVLLDQPALANQWWLPTQHGLHISKADRSRAELKQATTLSVVGSTDTSW